MGNRPKLSGSRAVPSAALSKWSRVVLWSVVRHERGSDTPEEPLCPRRFREVLSARRDSGRFVFGVAQVAHLHLPTFCCKLTRIACVCCQRLLIIERMSWRGRMFGWMSAERLGSYNKFLADVAEKWLGTWQGRSTARSLSWTSPSLLRHAKTTRGDTTDRSPLRASSGRRNAKVSR